jgi:hypothetical protein
VAVHPHQDLTRGGRAGQVEAGPLPALGVVDEDQVSSFLMDFEQPASAIG